jgi:hypothetical protein
MSVGILKLDFADGDKKRLYFAEALISNKVFALST